MKRLTAFAILITVLLSIFPTSIYAYSAESYLARETEKRYYYQDMTEEEQAIYNNLLDGIVNFKKEIPITSNSPRQLYEVLLKLRADFPEIFWVAQSYSYAEQNGQITMAILDYVYDSDEVDEIQKTIDEAIAEVGKRAENATEYSKAKIVFDYVCERITYNHNTYNAVNVDQAFLKGDAICGGFAKMYCVIANGLGIDCRMVVGCRNETADVAHSWNEVFIDGETIYVDCTWGDHTAISGRPNKYFDMGEEEFKQNHIEYIL